MGVTKLDYLNAEGAIAKLVTNLPATPDIYYNIPVDDTDSSSEWHGGEMVYLTTQNRWYIQWNTSGRTPMWKRLLEAFVTTTSTSSSTTTSSTTTSTTTTTTSSSTTTTTTTSTSTSSTTTS